MLKIIDDAVLVPFMLEGTTLYGIYDQTINELSLCDAYRVVKGAGMRDMWGLYLNKTRFASNDIETRFANLVFRHCPVVVVLESMYVSRSLLETCVNSSMRQGRCDQIALRSVDITHQTLDWFTGALDGIIVDYFAINDVYLMRHHVASLISCIYPSIRMINLSGCQLGQEGFQTLVDTMSRSGKNWNRLLTVRLGQNAIENLEPLPLLLDTCPRLRFLSFYGNNMIDDSRVPMRSLTHSIMKHMNFYHIELLGTNVSHDLTMKLNICPQVRCNQTVCILLAFASRTYSPHTAVFRLFPEVNQLLAVFLF